MRLSPLTPRPVGLALAGFLTLSIIAHAQEPPPRPGSAGQRGFGGGGGRGGFGPGTIIGSQMFSQADKNSDQKLTREEFAALADAWFDKLDTDKAGKLSQVQFTSKLGEILPSQQGSVSPGDEARGVSPPGGNPPDGGRRGRGSFGAAGFVGPGLFTAADANKDGSLTRAELKGAFEKWFAEWDSDKSGSINQDKLVAGLNGVLPRPNLDGRGRFTSNPSGTGPEAALKQTSQLVVADGLECTLFASEPMVVNPADMDIDSRGRVWVTEGTNYRASQNRVSPAFRPASSEAFLPRPETGGWKASQLADSNVGVTALAKLSGSWSRFTLEKGFALSMNVGWRRRTILCALKANERNWFPRLRSFREQRIVTAIRNAMS